MQYSMADIRGLGFKKLYKAINSNEFMKELHLLNSKLADINISPYSVLTKLQKTGVDIPYNYLGFKSLVNYINPLNSYKVEDHCKRSFRRFWTSLWGNFSKDVNLSSSDMHMLFDLGLKLAFTQRDIDGEVYDFFNQILMWGLLLESEYNADKLGLRWWDILAQMVELSPSEFGCQVIEWGISV